MEQPLVYDFAGGSSSSSSSSSRYASAIAGAGAGAASTNGRSTNANATGRIHKFSLEMAESDSRSHLQCHSYSNPDFNPDFHFSSNSDGPSRFPRKTARLFFLWPTLLKLVVVGGLVYASVDLYRYHANGNANSNGNGNGNGNLNNPKAEVEVEATTYKSTPRTYVGRNVRQQGRVTLEAELDEYEDEYEYENEYDYGESEIGHSLRQRGRSRNGSRTLASGHEFQTGSLTATATATATSTSKASSESNSNKHGDNNNSNNNNPNSNPNVGVPSEWRKNTYHYTNPKPLPRAVSDLDGNSQDDSQYKYEKYNYFLEDDVSSAMNPRIAWLASFPNSGTSFTMTMVARATNTTFATNYGIEANYGSRATPSLPIYPRHPEGPYMPDPETSFHHRSLPYGKHVITKTHCGGYCVNCGPDEYSYGYRKDDGGDEQEQKHEPRDATDDNDQDKDYTEYDEYDDHHHLAALEFLQDCASGHAIDDRGNLVDVSYPPERVSRVIHLIRNPFHNVIARFHLERKHHGDANTTEDRTWLESHPDNHEGLDLFCKEQNQERWDQETKFFESDFFQWQGEQTEIEENKNLELSYARRNGDHVSPTETAFGTRAGTGTNLKFSTANGNGNGNGNGNWTELVRRVPCRGDFFRYVQWHNLLHQALDLVPHKMPVLTVYYENYGKDFFETAGSVLDFLELQPVPGDKRGNVKWAEFRSRTDYEGFFSEEQVAAATTFVNALSSFRVWGEIRHYF
eukprot:CAMPEP_0172384888 /NCGR_PEP_ID=MMETSP1061-20121228/2588_1 /TAXON_ID=37318 /ORGANISM="Pseudo-nitzschia pungens, Strain cf. pungens" /LENGTH=740 /DNA_ID=CAMNT_0013113669 /DNA_START=278 /DNA_END=2500 /DNA_ORIENTATION=-